MSDHLNEDDQVGYGRPPKKTRFTKGQSGNPSGRRKRARTRLNSYDELLGRLVPVTLDGVTKRIPLEEALEMKIVEKAILLSPAALFKLLKELKSEAMLEREAQAREAMRRADGLVRQCVDCKEIVDALIALNVVTLEGQVRRVVPEMLYKLADRETVDYDPRRELVNLRRFYWPGTEPNHPPNDDDEGSQAA